MGNARFVLGCLVGAACGHIGFDPIGASGDARDDADGDGATGDGPMVQSCAGLLATCGPAATSPCCGSTLVPGGTFDRSYDVSGDGMYPGMSFPATVSDFRLDTYEVTVGRFRQFVNAGAGTQGNPPVAGAGAHPQIPGSGWDPTWNGSLVADTATLVADVTCEAPYQTWTDTPGANESLAMNCITWYESYAFCAWDGGFLPTEAEWNYAASGGSEQRAYPWSNPPSSLTIDCSYANYDNGTAYCVNPPHGAVNRVGTESPTGDGRWGQADLGGNVWEWTLDWLASPYTIPCMDCADLDARFEPSAPRRRLRPRCVGPPRGLSQRERHARHS